MSSNLVEMDDDTRDVIPEDIEGCQVNGANDEEWTVARVGPKPGRASAIVDLSPVSDERPRSMSVAELMSLLRHAGWSIE